ncbi:MAG: hypothetical protein AAF830_04090 [Pseudomonadota bacterium]
MSGWGEDPVFLEAWKERLKTLRARDATVVAVLIAGVSFFLAITLFVGLALDNVPGKLDAALWILMLGVWALSWVGSFVGAVLVYRARWETMAKIGLLPSAIQRFARSTLFVGFAAVCGTPFMLIAIISITTINLS